MQTVSSSNKAVLFTRCCDGLATADELHDMQERSREITLATFRRRTNLNHVAPTLGYVSGRNKAGVRIEKDPYIKFYRSTFRGKPCYWLDWSRIDHIFLTQDHIDQLN